MYKGVKSEKIDIFRHFEFVNFSEKFEKQRFSWVSFLHEIWHAYKIEGALSHMTPESSQWDIAFTVSPVVIL